MHSEVVPALPAASVCPSARGLAWVLSTSALTCRRSRGPNAPRMGPVHPGWMEDSFSKFREKQAGLSGHSVNLSRFKVRSEKITFLESQC